MPTDRAHRRERAAPRVHSRRGYGLLKDKQGIACIAMDAMPAMGAMGVHYAKSSLVADGKLKVTSPEALLYRPLAGASCSWPPSSTSCSSRPGTPVTRHRRCWKQNPAGTFALWNPQVSCK